MKIINQNCISLVNYWTRYFKRWYENSLIKITIAIDYIIEFLENKLAIFEKLFLLLIWLYLLLFWIIKEIHLQNINLKVNKSKYIFIKFCYSFFFGDFYHKCLFLFYITIKKKKIIKKNFSLRIFFIILDGIDIKNADFFINFYK